MRLSAYESAIAACQEQLKDKVVLDLGCGYGLLSMLCAQVGVLVWGGVGGFVQLGGQIRWGVCSGFLTPFCVPTWVRWGGGAHLHSNTRWCGAHAWCECLGVAAGIALLVFTHPLMCMQAGARHVYGVDASAAADTATKVVAANGLAGRVTILKGQVEAITLPVHKVCALG